MNQSKISRKLRKCLMQLQRYDPDVEVSSVPTNVSDNFRFKISIKFNIVDRHASYLYLIFNE